MHFVIAAAGAGSVTFESRDVIDGTINATSLRSTQPVRMLIRVAGDPFVDGLGHDASLNVALIESISTNSSVYDEPTGWTAIVAPALRAAAASTSDAITRLDRRTVRVSIAAASAYHIVQPETLSVHLPAQLLLSNISSAASSHIVLSPNHMDLHLAGPLVSLYGGINETMVRKMNEGVYPGAYLDITLNHYYEGSRSRWPFNLADPSSSEVPLILESLRGCYECDPAPSMSWYRSVPIALMSIERIDNHTARIHLPTADLASYDIGDSPSRRAQQAVRARRRRLQHYVS